MRRRLPAVRNGPMSSARYVGGIRLSIRRIGDPLVELAGEAAAVGGVAELGVEPQGGLVELVDAETNLRDAAVAGPAVGFGHQPRADAAALMGLRDGEFLDHGVSTRPEGRDIGHFSPFQSLHSHQPHDIAIHLSHEQRLVGVGQMRVEQPLRAGRLVGGPKPVRALSRMEHIGLGV